MNFLKTFELKTTITEELKFFPNLLACETFGEGNRLKEVDTHM